MLDVLFGGLPTIIGGLFGVVGAALPQLFELLRGPQRLKELEARQRHAALMFDKSIEQSKVDTAARLEAARIDAESAGDVERQISHRTIVAASSQWVKNLSGCVRPVITLSMFSVWAYVRWCIIDIATRNGVDFQMAVVAMWDSETQALFGAVIGFWFTGRYLNDKRPDRS